MASKNFFFIITFWMGGGVESVFKTVAKILINSGNKVHLFVVNGFDSSKYNIDDSIVLIRKFSDFRLIKHQSKNTVVVNFNGDWKSGFYSFLLDREYISWVHGNPITMRKAKTWIVNFLLLKKSTMLVCVCHEQMELLRNKYHFNNKMQVIYNSIDFEEIQHKSNDSLPTKFGKYILMCARMDLNSKDFFTLIDAYDVLPDALKQKYSLVLLGDGKDMGKIKEYVMAKNLSEKIIFPGFDSNPFRWMKNCSCFVLSSLTEGFSLVPIETMACDAPVVLTRYHTGSAEISDNGKNALLVECGDAKGMAQSIETILENQNIKNEIVENATQFVKQFSIHNFEREILDLFGLADGSK